MAPQVEVQDDAQVEGQGDAQGEVQVVCGGQGVDEMVVGKSDLDAVRLRTHRRRCRDGRDR